MVYVLFSRSAVVMVGDWPADCCGVATEWIFYSYYNDTINFQIWDSVDLDWRQARMVAEFSQTGLSTQGG